VVRSLPGSVGHDFLIFLPMILSEATFPYNSSLLPNKFDQRLASGTECEFELC
jgi:hypothetical protein